MKISGQRRKAISPIVATVLIIAATLIAFAAVLGYIFGIFGSAAAKANVQISSQTSVAHALAPGSASVVLINTGTASTTVTSATLSAGGSTCTVTLPTTTLTAGSTTTLVSTAISCTPTVTVNSGQTFTLSVVLADGSPATYQGVFS